MWNQLGLALSFLTVFRLPGTRCASPEPQDLAGSMAWFPLVGLVLGAVTAGAARLIAGGPTWPAATAVVALMALLTRGLHLDGLADLADGIAGSHTRERRLEIMKDSRVGTFGVLALVFAVLFKVAAIEVLMSRQSWIPLLLVPAMSRLGMVLAAYRMAHARKAGGLAQPFLEHLHARQVWTAVFLGTAPLLAWDFRSGALCLLLLLLCVGLFRTMAARCLGGTTGDVLGAVNEVVEISLFFLSAAILRS